MKMNLGLVFSVLYQSGGESGYQPGYEPKTPPPPPTPPPSGGGSSSTPTAKKSTYTDSEGNVHQVEDYTAQGGARYDTIIEKAPTPTPSTYQTPAQGSVYKTPGVEVVREQDPITGGWVAYTVPKNQGINPGAVRIAPGLSVREGWIPSREQPSPFRIIESQTVEPEAPQTLLQQIRNQPGYAVSIDRSAEYAKISELAGLPNYSKMLFPGLYQAKPPTAKPEIIFDTKYGMMRREDTVKPKSLLDVPEFKNILGGGKSTESMITYPIYTVAVGAKDFLHRVADRINPKSILSPAYYGIKALGNVAEFGGMIPAGTERLIKNPQMILPAMGAGLLMQVGGIPEQIKASPPQFIADIAAFGFVTHGAGRVAARGLSKLPSSTFTPEGLKTFMRSESASGFRKGEVDPWAKAPTMRQVAEEKGLDFKGGYKPPDAPKPFVLQPGESQIKMATGQFQILKTVLKPPEAIAVSVTKPLQLGILGQKTAPLKQIQVQIQTPKTITKSIIISRPLMSQIELAKIKQANLNFMQIGTQTQKKVSFPLLLSQVSLSKQKNIAVQVQRQKMDIPQVSVSRIIQITPQLHKEKTKQKQIIRTVLIPIQVQRQKMIIPQLQKTPQLQVPALILKNPLKSQKEPIRTKTPQYKPPPPPPRMRFKPPEIKPQKSSPPRLSTPKSIIKGKFKFGKFPEISRVASARQILKGRKRKS